MKLNFTVTAEQEIYKLQNSLDGSVSGSWIHFMTTEACITTEPQCPLKTGTVAVYSLSVPVSKLYPKVLVTIQSEMRDKDGDGDVCVCLEVEGRIV